MHLSSQNVHDDNSQEDRHSLAILMLGRSQEDWKKTECGYETACVGFF